MIDGFGWLSSHVEWSEGEWFAEAKPEVRAVASPGVMNAPPEAVTARLSRRLLNIRRLLTRNEGGEAYFDFDRLNVRYRYENGDVFVGRKPVSLGVLRFFPVWNKLTLPIIFQPGPEWIENPDVIGGSYTQGQFSHRLFASRGEQAQVDDLVMIESRYAGQGFEVQLLLGELWQHIAMGLAGSVDAFEASLRFETLWIEPFRDERGQAQVGLGFERALDEKWTIVTEALYQSEGQTDTRVRISPFGVPQPAADRFQVLSGRYYLLPYVSYQVHPLWLLRAGVLAGFGQRLSSVVLTGFEHSLSDNTSLILKVKWPLGPSDGEFGAERVRDPLGRTFGMASTALLQLQATF